MDSWYYFCDVEDKPGEQNLDDYEKEYDYQVEWLTLDEIICKNQIANDTEHIPWVVREAMVMKELKEYIE